MLDEPIHTFAGPFRTAARVEEPEPEPELSLIEALKRVEWRWDGDKDKPWFVSGKFKVTWTSLLMRKWITYERIPITESEHYDLYKHLKLKLKKEISIQEEQQRKRAEEKARKLQRKATKIARSL